MKKVLFFGLLFCAAMTYVACDQVVDNPAGVLPGDEDIENPEDLTPSQLETYFFSIEDARYVGQEFPAQTIDEVIQGLNVNLHAIKGGTNLIQVITSKVYTEFYVGAKDVPGYFLWVPSRGTSDNEPGEGGQVITENDIYKMAVLFSTLLNDEITLLVSAKDEQGEVTKPLELVISFVETKTQVGDLNVNLFFSNDKDVDLRLLLPSGEELYYGHHGGTYEDEEGNIVEYGLDLDSNPGCHIDGIRNENIFVPAQLVTNGTYTVIVDLYANCDSSIPTDWQVIARYNEELLENEIEDARFAGRNPVSGTYPVGAISHDLTRVMQFTITNVEETETRAPRLIRSTYKPTPLKDTDWAKLSDEEFKAAVKEQGL